MWLEPATVKPTPEALEAVRNADVIVLGPGSLFTSIIPNVLVPGMTEAIVKSRAVKIAICNLMTQPGETPRFTVSDHIQALVGHSDRRLFEYVVVNVDPLSPLVLERYAREGAEPVQLDDQALRHRDYSIVKARLVVSDAFARHDPAKLARCIMKIVSI